MQNAHNKSVQECLDFFNVSINEGLSEKQVKQNREKYGINEFPKEPKTPFWKLVLDQFDDMLVKILLAAAVISALLAVIDLYNGEGDYHAFVEPFIIMLILVLNAIVGVWQESSAEAAIEALKEYEAPEAVVLRESVIRQIPAVDVVPGDILIVSVGNMVPADARVLQLISTTVRVDQAALTGEAVSVLKSEEVVKQERIELQGKTNTIFSGTMITYGKVKALAVATGKDSEIGKIQDKIQNSEEVETPLQKKLDEFADVLSKIIAIICVVVWAVNINHFTDKNFGSWYKGAIYYFKIAVSLAVAAIPEGLPSVVTICLALGTRRMAKKNAIVKSLPSVETLGCTSVICSDKTGTLTQNSMSIIKMFTISTQKQVHLYHVEDSKWKPQGKITDNNKTIDLPANVPAFAKIAAISALANDSNLTIDGEKIKVVGEPTEAAMRVLVEKIGVSNAKENNELASKPLSERLMYVNHMIEKQYQKISTLEFTRTRKSMSAIARSSADKSLTLFCKGAPECILERCEKVLLEDGSIVDLDKTARERILSQTKTLSEGEALRCIGVAYKPVGESVLSKPELKDPSQFDVIESGMIFVGVVGMLDPPRPEVKEAVEKCKSAGIRVIVITGDNKNTAAAICRQIGIFDQTEGIEGLAYTGQEFDDLSPEKKKEAVLKARLFSRVEPSHKMEIVQLLQANHDIVAMTGDGVNDSPALKQADIGIGMGSGTNVAKNASKMVLQDDNFSTIVKAIEEGRGIYNNTKQFIRYLISSNIGEVVAIFLTAALGMPEALVPVQLLFVNLVTDGLPSIALSFNPVERDVMKRRPRDARAPIIDRWLFIRYLVIGTYVGFATVAGFAWWFMFYSQGPHITFYDLTHFHSCIDDGSHTYSCSIFADSLHASTMSLTILVTIEMFNAMNAISENESIFVFPPFKNIYLILAIISSMALHFVILYVPFIADIFGVAPLNLEEWTAVVLLSLPVIAIDEVLKLISRTFLRK